MQGERIDCKSYQYQRTSHCDQHHFLGSMIMYALLVFVEEKMLEVLQSYYRWGRSEKEDRFARRRE